MYELETPYREKLELCQGTYKDYYGSCTEYRIVTLSDLHSTLKKCTEIFARRCAELKENFIIDIDRDVDYRDWSDLWAKYAEQTTVDDDIREVLQRLCNTLRRMADTIDALAYSDKQYERLYQDVRGSYALRQGAIVASEYDVWKGEHLTSNIPELPFQHFVDESIAGLLRSGVFDGVRSNASEQDVNRYLTDFDFNVFAPAERVKMQTLYCRFREIYNKKQDGMYSVKMSNAGRLLFRLRKEPDKLEALLHFNYMLNLINPDIDSLRNANRVISICGDIDFSHLPCRFNDEEVRESGIKKHAKDVLAVMDHMQGQAVYVSYWFGFYCVLLEKGWIENNLNRFCINMKRLFGVKLNVSNFSKTKDQLVLDINEWPEFDPRTKAKKAFGLQFKAYLDFYQHYLEQLFRSEFQN